MIPCIALPPVPGHQRWQYGSGPPGPASRKSLFGRQAGRPAGTAPPRPAGSRLTCASGRQQEQGERHSPGAPARGHAWRSPDAKPERFQQE